MKTAVKGGPIRHRIGASGTFVLRTVAGSVRVRGTDTDEAVVVARGDSGEALPLIVNRSDGALHVEPERHGRTFFGAAVGVGMPEIDFEVELPRGARIEINSVSADVAGSDLHGDQSYKLVSGDIELTGSGGRIDARSVSGDMTLRAGQPVEISAVTTSGDLQVQGGQLDLLRLRSVSGDATVAGRFAAGPEHRVETVSGDLNLQAAGGLAIEASGPIVGLRSTIAGRVSSDRGRRGLVIGDGAARLRFRSMSGQVHVSETDAQPSATAASQAAPRSATPHAESLEILRALEQGEIDVEEATRLLGGEGERA